jgi:uncharacterized membrane protein
MPDVDTDNPKSTAKIAGHPVHPMIIPFPITFFVSTLVTDVAYLSTARAGFAEASTWLLGAGIATALLAAVFGFTDFLSERRIRAMRQSWLHMIGNLLVVILEAVNLSLRYRGGAMPAVAVGEAALSLVSVCLLLFTGWMGWEMVYRGHVGVADRAMR